MNNNVQANYNSTVDTLPTNKNWGGFIFPANLKNFTCILFMPTCEKKLDGNDYYVHLKKNECLSNAGTANGSVQTL